MFKLIFDKTIISKILQDTSGQAMVEYALMVGMIVALILAVFNVPYILSLKE